MNIVHEVGSQKKRGEGTGSFLLGDGKGGYLSLPNSDTNNSNYQGWLTFNQEDWELYKTIENIYVDGKVDTLINRFSHIERTSKKTKEKFFLYKDALLYQVLNYSGQIHIDLDFRKIHDHDDQGRNYVVYECGGGIIIIKYQKNSGHEGDHEYYLVIKNVKEFETPENWYARDYSSDKNRNSRSDFHIFGTLRIKASEDTLVLAHASSEREAVEKVNRAWHYDETIMNLLEKNAVDELNHKNMALNAAINSLNALTVAIEHNRRDVGVFAGFPWFYQFWARDELICCKALMIQKNYFMVKDILMSYLDQIEEGGWLANRNVGSDLKSADGIGWLFFRFHNFLGILKKEDKVYDYFTQDELNLVKEKLDFCISKIKDHLNKDLVTNSNLETWMDTSYNNDYRSGERIEIQALHLAIYRFSDFLYNILGKKSHHKKEEERLKKATQHFLVNGVLFDGINDPKQRPNIFLAYYVYPDLFSKAEWKKAFDNALKSLWLSWGGLSSIDKKNDLFVNEYSGIDNKSYHRGDSWFYINNMAAICMQDLDKKHYSKYIKKIKEASEKEILFSGIIGHSAEVSSAKELRSEGAGCQAWSAATFIELMN